MTDAAALRRCQQAGGPAGQEARTKGEQRWPDLMSASTGLITAGVIPTEKCGRWDLARGLRNAITHASIRHLTPPHEALRVLELLAVEIDALFASESSLDTNAAF